MREIKFRAWNSQQMLYRGLCDRNWYNAEDKQVCVALPEDAHNWRIMQYTGLHDKNGVEIYEEDIVALSGSNMRGKGQIVFSEGAFYIDRPGAPYLLLRCALPHVIEVVGSIYENPELEGEKE